MDPIPFVTEGLDLPAEQPMTPGQAHGYVGIYVIDAEPRIVISLTNPFLKFGKIENWAPVFECALPIVIGASAKQERFFQIRFTGIPGERENFVQGKLCVRNVRIISIQKMFEGQNPPIIR